MKIQFYLNEILTETLKSKGLEGESPHLTAKRLMEDLLKGEVVPSAIAPSSDALAEINDRLSALENRWEIDTGDRLAKLEDSLSVLKKAVTALETIAPITPDQVAELSDRLSALEGKDRKLESLFQDIHGLSLSNGNALERVSDRLSALENKMSDRPALPKREIPRGLTHKEIAAAIGSSERTMQRAAKEKERWPEGYHWSEESKKWFPLEG